ncbi:SDR family NAD(P)-dependent oxidoreductase [Jiangella ureilytica]|uniref:SDR family NAD(P)-dependent oxidoreductase n=1 Tax=Jiangella ureilytica TaxID=2530374 RepID=A0A4R4RZB8_9ACTN|nr:SDR family NAD(P)-dependent oxidoreductase [Jiangella ureilytica]TDC54352.1 SDR family NAD(P)-dependent oxidoreductase [Jiangella ureilytica]
MTDPVLLITGASRGIGAAVARRAAAAGYRLALTARAAGPLHALADELGDDGVSPGHVLARPVDVTDWTALTGLVAEVEERFGRLDAVLANAGASVLTSFLGDGGAPPEEWRDLVLTNVLGPALTARATLPALRRTRGHLLLTGSTAGRGVRSGSLYSATKWAVTGLAQAIHAECAGTGVRVTLLQPGLTDTGSIPPSRRDDPRLDPGDVAEAVLYALRQPPHVDVAELVVRPIGRQL